ncbi:hypothetical protein [Streptomyces sp. NPDC090445]|uniref:hypothetical protein n=1 Tax=Streptomyces sp. NPDC090445 TaxID=3365963 RepID=UPI00382EBBF2
MSTPTRTLHGRAAPPHPAPPRPTSARPGPARTIETALEHPAAPGCQVWEGLPAVPWLPAGR